MAYRTDYSGPTKIAYDGELLPLDDALYRINRDEEREHRYKLAVEDREDEQLSWDDIEELL